ncbi:hypothetical protein R1flu_011849 [Riccia fluitans]|uniref:Uncharacterized protein n=1 Tax=Riccia fluitans TaxID=41844 RepID=A0ABD1Z8Y6_9MARC
MVNEGENGKVTPRGWEAYALLPGYPFPAVISTGELRSGASRIYMGPRMPWYQPLNVGVPMVDVGNNGTAGTVVPGRLVAFDGV